MYFIDTDQFIVLFFSFLLGAFLGIIFDLFKIKRCMFGAINIVLFIDDMLFMLFSAFAFVIFAFVANSGHVRWYELISTILGFIVYRLTISKIVMRFFEWAIKLIKKILKWAFSLILKPLKKLIKLIINLIKKLLLFIRCVYNKEKRNCRYRKSKQKIKRAASCGFEILKKM